MAWCIDDAAHEGNLCAVVPDGRISIDLSRGVVLVEGVSGNYLRHPDASAFEIVPDDDVIGWRAVCVCGWTGPMWTRANLSREENLSQRRAFVPFLGRALPSVTVEHRIRQEWHQHAAPAAAIAELVAAVRDWKRARRRLENGVGASRRAGVSWGRIGDVLGISRQSAHERWKNST